jgi:hypothetical protein
MNPELTDLESLLQKVHSGPFQPGTVFRVVYAKALSAYDPPDKPPVIDKHDIKDFPDAKTVQYYELACESQSCLVILFRKTVPVYLAWKDHDLRVIGPTMLPFSQWLTYLKNIQNNHTWDVDLKALLKDPKDFLKTQHMSIRAELYRVAALDRVKRVLVLCQEVNDEVIKLDAMQVLKFAYDCGTLCQVKTPPKPWHPMEIKESLQIHNDSERDLYVKLFRTCYDSLKLEEIRKMLISYATDMWDEYGYSYPIHFADVGKPVSNRYALFVAFTESTRPVVKVTPK